MLPLTDAVIAEIRRLGNPGSNDALLFALVGHPDRRFHFERARKQALTEARIENFRLHDLRHTCASHLAQQAP